VNLFIFVLGMMFMGLGPWVKTPEIAAGYLVAGAILVSASLICREIEGKS
jgi:hypothetical protein